MPEYHQGGNAANGVACGQGSLLFGIHLDEPQTRFKFVRHIVEDGGKLLAGAAPAGPKIDNHRDIGLDQGIKLRLLSDAGGLAEQGRLAVTTVGRQAEPVLGQAVSFKAVTTIGSDK